jgi:hypothetical protein
LANAAANLETSRDAHWKKLKELEAKVEELEAQIQKLKNPRLNRTGFNRFARIQANQFYATTPKSTPIRPPVK